MRVTETRTPIREAGRAIDVPVAVATWVGAFAIGQAASLAILATAGVDDVDDVAAIPIPTLFAAVAATWIAYVVGAWAASRRSGTGHVVDDYRLRFAPADIAGVPVGVLTQLVVVPLVYWPLTRAWPDTFTDDRLSETAEKLVDQATGVGMVLLVLMVCVCAPVVEEIVYRGLLQGSFAARFDRIVAWPLVALWFAVIHFRPVEYPGLFAFGLVAGACVLVTGRLGTAITTHVAFNVTGLVLALR